MWLNIKSRMNRSVKCFFNIPTIRNQIAFRQLNYIGKIFRRESTHIPTSLLTAWYNHPRKVGRSLLTNKQCIVRNLQIFIPEVDDNGTLASWVFHALDTSFWNTLLRTLEHSGNDPPESPPNTSFPQTNSSPPASPREPPSPETPPYHTPPRSQPPSPHRGTENFDKSGIGYNLYYSFGVLGIEMVATVREVKNRYRKLARRLHPDKHDPNDTGVTSEEAVKLFKLVNNAQQFLCTTLCN